MRRLRTKAAAVATGAALALVTACGSGGGGDSELVLDGSPRVPDAEGIATIARPDLIEVAGRQFDVSPDLVVFSTHDLSLTPLVRWEGSYVQVGLDGDTVVWLAGVAGVISGDPPTAQLSGRVEAVEGDRLVLEGGTVVTLGEGVDPLPEGTFVIVRLDPISGLVRQLLEA